MTAKKKKGTQPIIIPVRLKPELGQELAEVTEAIGISRIDFIRMAIKAACKRARDKNFQLV